jgi:adenylate cyclase
VPEVGDTPLPEIEHAIRMGDVVTVSPASANPPVQAGAYAHALAVPIKLRDQIIGVIDLHETDDSREWTEDDVAIVTEIADQAAQALENVRLFEQTQQHARREQLTATIAARLRAAPNVEGVLKATVHEIRRALGVSHGVVRLKTGETQTVIDTTA